MKAETKAKVGKGIFALAGVIGAGALLLMATGTASSDDTQMVVYKNPSCGCCTKWADQMNEHGFDTDVRPVSNIRAIKQEAGVPSGMRSCHTAKVDGYFIEGHVPAADIKRLLQEKPDIAGLTAPGMPIGSPGMEVPGRSPDRYKVYAIDHKGHAAVFATHGG